MRVLLDSNILVRWLESGDTQHTLVVRAVESILNAGDIPCYTSQNLGEFWNVLTRPLDRNGFGLTPHEADRRARMIESRIGLLPDGPSIHNEWRRLLVANNVCGVQVHDARLVAAMRVHGITRILTLNHRDFARFTGIQAVHPSQLATP